MPVHLLYPSNPLRLKQPDEQYLAEVEAVRLVGFNVSLFSLEDFQIGSFRPFPPLPHGVKILYRGWMLSATDYESLTAALLGCGVEPFTDVQSYLATHYLPNWYPLISELTPETRVYPSNCELELELRRLDWPEYFIKDYVKSLKTSIGSRISKPEQVTMVAAEMRRFRGTIEGGFCVRRVENYFTETEQRYFVLDRQPHGISPGVPAIVNECAKRIPSRFYSIDVVKRTDGQHRIVEIGDGQVSDLVGWTPEQFSRMLAASISNRP